MFRARRIGHSISRKVRSKFYRFIGENIIALYLNEMQRIMGMHIDKTFAAEHLYHLTVDATVN